MATISIKTNKYSENKSNTSTKMSARESFLNGSQTRISELLRIASSAYDTIPDVKAFKTLKNTINVISSSYTASLLVRQIAPIFPKSLLDIGNTFPKSLLDIGNTFPKSLLDIGNTFPKSLLDIGNTFPKSLLDIGNTNPETEIYRPSDGWVNRYSENESPKEVEVLLQMSFGSNYVEMYRGAWHAFYGNNPDRIRHSFCSLRELWRNLIKQLAPDNLVRQYLSGNPNERKGKVSREKKLLYISQSSNSYFIKSDIGGLEYLLDFLNCIHDEKIEITDESFRHILLESDFYLDCVMAKSVRYSPRFRNERLNW